MAQFLSALIYFFLVLMSIFLICLVLIQRGKGGGLAGAFGGPGGSSAFGSKAGDIFTRVTMVSAGIWIVLNMILVVLANQGEPTWNTTDTPGSASKSAFTPNADGKDTKGGAAPADGKGAPLPGGPEGKSATAPAPAGTGSALAPAPAAAGKGATTTGPAMNEGLPSSVFAPESAPLPPPAPAGSTPAPGGTGPKP